MGELSELVGRTFDVLDTEIKTLKEENAKLKTHIQKLNDVIAAKNRTINRLQHESWDDVTYERDDR